MGKRADRAMRERLAIGAVAAGWTPEQVRASLPELEKFVLGPQPVVPPPPASRADLAAVFDLLGVLALQLTDSRHLHVDWRKDGRGDLGDQYGVIPHVDNVRLYPKEKPEPDSTAVDVGAGGSGRIDGG